MGILAALTPDEPRSSPLGGRGGTRLSVFLVLVLVLAAGVRVRYFTGLQVGDDVVYSKIAVDRLSGTFSVHNVHQTRSGFLLALMGSYALFGPGEVPLVLYNLLCSLGLVAALFLLGRRLFGEGAGVAAGLLAALHPNLVRFATECHTDTPVALWLTLAFAALLERDRPRQVLAGLLVGWAYLHKEHAVFALPFLLAIRAWPALAAFAGVFAAELLGFALLTDTPFKRFEMVRYWHAGQYMAEQYPTSSAILFRLFLDLPLKLLNPLNGLVFPLALAAAWAGRRHPDVRRVGAWALVLALGYAFWPSSIRPFRPGFTLYDWTLPVLWPGLILLLARIPRAAILGISLAHLIAIHVAWTKDRELLDGPREARAWLRERPFARVFTDDKTAEALDFWEGHDPGRRYIPFQAEAPSRGAVILDRVRTRPGRWWSRPGVEPRPGWRLLHESGSLSVYEALNVDSP